jgi:hypothetical protein
MLGPGHDHGPLGGHDRSQPPQRFLEERQTSAKAPELFGNLARD